MNKLIINFLFLLFLIESVSLSVTDRLSMVVNHNDDYNQMNNNIDRFYNQSNLCQRILTLSEILELLKQQPCTTIIEKNQEENRSIRKRSTDAGNIDIHALQTTINDHRTMINYLINNSINATFVSNAIGNHHSKTGPILTSWRDIVDLIFIILLIGMIIYFLLCRAGFTRCDNVLSVLFKPVTTRIQQQQQTQPQPQTTLATIESIHRKRSRLHAPEPSFPTDDPVRFNNGYNSE